MEPSSAIIDRTRPMSIRTGGTGRKKTDKMPTIDSAKAMSFVPRAAAGGILTAAFTSKLLPLG